MTDRPKDLLNKFMDGLEQVSKTNGEHVSAFINLLETAYKPGAVDVKTKELISIGIAVYNRCEYCIVFHVYKSLEAGATKEEIMEAAMVGVAFGGGPSMSFAVGLLKDSIAAFEGEFKK